MRARLSLLCAALALTATHSVRAADPSVGECLSATESSLALRNAHKLRAAQAALQVCSAASCPAEIREECLHRIATVGASMPTLLLTVKTGEGKELTDVKVTADGEVLTDRLDGKPLPLDPGSHQLTFEVSGQPPVSQTFVLREGEKNRQETVVVAIPAPQPAVGVPVTSPPESDTASSDGWWNRRGNRQRFAGVVVGGAGVVSVVLGGVFGGLSFSSWSQANTACPSHAGCSPAATSERSSAVSDATGSTVGFVAAGLLLAGGLTLYLTAPKSKTEAPRMGVEVGPGALGLAGRF
jgi:hypothetical protein